MILRALSLLLGASIALGLDFRVSPNGCERNCPPGTTWSLQGAKAAVRQSIAQGMTEDITIHMADGMYYLDKPLTFTSADSGQNGYTVLWRASGSNATISGGQPVTGWVRNATSRIWEASVPPGTQSRNLYVNGWAANYARHALDRTYFTATNTSFKWDVSDYDWLMTTPGISNAELRQLGSFTDRYAPIKAVGERELVMSQWSWLNQDEGYDDFAAPFADFGLFVQNALALLDEGGEFYLDMDIGKVYYMPLDGEDMSKAETFLGLLEAVVVVGGTLDDPAHDISFHGLNFAHTTWMRPATYGYVDQQTGGYIGANVTYPTFEASREHWYLMPSAIQISAAHNIHFQGGTYTQLGAGGLGIGNDHEACVTGVGLAAKNISVRRGYFTQVMGNSITAGGIQIPAHHPSDSRMINSEIHVEENIFFNTSSLFSSTVPVFFSYVQDSSIVHNDISHTPYSGICHGYGWGMNDAGGSQTYIARGTYKYQPLFLTPTTSKNNQIKGNLVNDYGWSHADLGSLYTLSKSPSTQLVENCAYDSLWYGIYTDEGSNSLTIQDNTFLNLGNLGSEWGWYNPNQGIPIRPGMHTANNTLVGNAGVWAPGRDFTDAPDGTGVLNNTFLRNFVVHELADMTATNKRVAYRAGIPPAARKGRPVSNSPSFEDAHAAIHFPASKHGVLRVTLQNFDDSELTGLSFRATASHGAVLKPIHMPATVPGDSETTASWHLLIPGCQTPEVSVQIAYTNIRTQITKSMSLSGTMPGLLPLDEKWTPSSTWPASYGQLCDTIGIRSGGRNVNGTYDDWAVLAHEAVISSEGSVTARVTSLDWADPWSKAGVVIRDSFRTKSPPDDASHLNSTGYAALMVTPGNGLIMQWSPIAFDSLGDGFLSRNMTVSEVTAPIYLRLNVSAAHATGFYSTDGHSWTKVGDPVILPRHQAASKAGLIVNSHAGYRNATAVFDSVAVIS